MKNATSERQSAHLATLSKIRARWKSAGREFEVGNSQAAARLINEAMAALMELAGTVAKEYPECLLENKISGVVAASASPFSERPDSPSLDSDIEKRLAVLNKGIGRLREEVNSNYASSMFRSLARRCMESRRFSLWVLALTCAGATLFAVRGLVPQKAGLVGSFYKGENFDTFAKSRVDKVVDFDWGHSAPLFLLPRDHFSARWTGYLYVPAEANYEFIIPSDDGIRFHLGNTTVINDWTWRSRQESRAKVHLASGYYPLQLEYFDTKRTASISLKWKSEFDAVEAVIPATNLTPERRFLDPNIPLHTGLERSIPK